MKFDLEKTFQYPVLRDSSHDYLVSTFQDNPDPMMDEGKLIIGFQYELDNSELQEEIDKGNAEFVTIISCRSTYYSKVIKTKEKNFRATIYGENISRVVEFCSYVVSKKDIKNFRSKDFNEEFGESAFNIDRRCVLAQTLPRGVNCKRDYYKPISTCFVLEAREGMDDGDWDISIRRDKVVISVSPSTKQILERSRSRHAVQAKSILINSLWFAATTHLIDEYKRDNVHDESLKVTVRTKCDLLDIKIDQGERDCDMPTAVIAKRLLHEPLKMMLLVEPFSDDVEEGAKE